MQPIPKSPDDRAAEIVARKRRSHAWMEANFYAQWEQVYRAYLCEAREVRDPNTGAVDTSRTSAGAPDTWSTTNRFVARVTAQAPNMRFVCRDADLAELISRTLMYQWDEAGIQRLQKKHVRQACLFGWSVRPWYWERNVMMRRKRIDVMDQGITEEALAAVQELYAGILQGADVRNPAVRAQLLALKGKGNLLPVEYPYVAYQGPKADFLFAGDCYPQPNFQGIQSSKWFIVERRRNRDWLVRMAKALPEFAPGIQKLMQQYPRGSQRKFWGGNDTANLRSKLLGVVQQSQQEIWEDPETDEWTITEEHRPGLRPTVTLLGEDEIMLGEIDSPYDLDGRVPFTELLFIDNLLHGVGDSAVRVLRTIQDMHSRMLGARSDVYDYAIRPLVGTSDLDLFDNPDRIKVRNGFRMALMAQGPQSLWFHETGTILQAAAATFAEEGNLARQWQSGTGDSNISMMANVDPQQARTATGARLLSAQLDTLTRDAIDMFTQTSLRDDALMMYQLNRSELADAIEFNAGPYARARNSSELEWVTVEPALFQRDGQITVEAGSTLADDDEASFERATGLYQMFSGNPLVDQKKLIHDVLVGFRKGREAHEYMADPPPPDPKVKPSLSVSVKAEILPPEVLAAILQESGLLPEQSQPQGPPPSPEGMPPGMPQDGPMAPPEMAPMMPEQPGQPEPTMPQGVMPE